MNKKKKIIAGIQKKLRRNLTFHYLSRVVTKGVRDSAKRLQVPNNNEFVVVIIK